MEAGAHSAFVGFKYFVAAAQHTAFSFPDSFVKKLFAIGPSPYSHTVVHTISFPIWFLALSLAASNVCLAGSPNQLTDDERSAGWQLLFDGKTSAGWRGIGKSIFPADKWAVENGWLHALGKGGGDIISTNQFEQFELAWEWKLVEGGNSGVKYFVLEPRGPIGHEYQMLDDNKHPDGKLAEGKRLTAAFYDVLKTSAPTALKAPGDINQSRILVKGNHVEHWLNGSKVLEYECGSAGVKAAVAASKFSKTAGFGERAKGHILLQDHNDEVWFRSIRIRDLSKN